jgi:hypothetical protein
MEELEIPIFKKLYDLYKLIGLYRASVAKAERYTIWQRVDTTCIDLIEQVISASNRSRAEKLLSLEEASIKLNLLRIFVRMAKDTKVIDPKKYLAMQVLMDEIGRMLGGWLRASKPAPPPVRGWFLAIC